MNEIKLSLDRIKLRNKAMDQSHKKKIEEVMQWLSDNVTVIPEPKEITLNRFDCNWKDWNGSFRVSFDNFTLLRNFQYGLDLTGYTVFSEPGFTSPLGAPATYSAVEMTDNTSKAILEGLKLTFPKLKPCGKILGEMSGNTLC